MLLLTIFVVTVNLRVFQTFLGRKVSDIVTNQLKTPFQVEQVKLGYFLRIEMKNAMALDEYYDTLFKADRISFTLSEIDRQAKMIRFNDLGVRDLSFHLIKHKGDSVLNIDYITERLKDTTSKESWGVQFADLAVNNSRFRLDNRNEPREYGKMDFNHLDVKNLDASIQNLSVINDTISAWVQSLDASEQSGFVLNELDAHLSISPTGWEWDFVSIETPYSELSLDFVFDYYDYKDLSDFVNSVYISAALHDCRVSMADMKYFIPPLKGINNTVEISGDIQGRIDDISSENMVINYGRGTRFKGDFAAKGLPQVENTFFDVQIRNFATNSTDIQSIQLGENDTLIIPEPLNKLARLTLKGEFLGKPLDFSSNAQLKSNLGDINADITMAKGSGGRPFYKGSLSGDSLLLGVLAGMPEEFGSMNFNTQIEGNGLGKDYQANLDGFVNNLHFRGNRFDSLSIYGEAKSRSFSGNLRLRDDNLSFDFAGTADLSKENLWFDFQSTILNANLNALKIPNKSDSLSRISAKINADFTGNHLDSISGFAQLTELDYHQDNFIYKLDTLTVRAHQDQYTEKRIEIRSDFMDGDILGGFQPSTIISSYTNLLHKYLPSIFVHDSIPKENQNFTFNFHLKDMQGISQVFLPSVRVSDHSRIHGSYNSGTGDIFLETNIGTLSYNDIKLNDFRFHSTGKKDAYQTSVKAGNILFKEYEDENVQAIGLEGFELSTRAKKDFLYYDLKWDDIEKSDKNKALIKGTFRFDSPSDFTHRVTESNIRISDTLWQVDRRNYISVTDSSTAISEFSVFSDHQKVFLNGTLSEKPEDSLRIDFNEFNLSDFDMIYATSDMDVDGILNGYMQFSTLAGRTAYTGDIKIDKLALNEEKMGEASFYSTWVDSTEQLNIQGDIVYTGNSGERTLMQLSGGYWPRPRMSEDSLSFSTELNNFSIEALKPLFDDFLKDINGWASGELTLGGSTQKPALSGEVSLMRSSLKIGYLNTRYYLADKIKLRPNAIVFDSIKIYDTKGNPATLDGAVTHQYFKDFALDLHIDSRNFAGLNTTRVDNDLFYGKAFATGKVDITGPVDDIQLDVVARTDPNTNVVIPISTSESVMDNDFIVFMSDEETEEEQQSLTFKKMQYGGLNMNFELEITPDAQAEIILPFSMGTITGRGGGNLKLEITSAGEFNMYGDYIIEEGSFLFSLQNMLRRNFSIQRGGTISWNGNPYNAILDISAIYKVRPTLNLPAAESYPELASERIPVNCIINLKDKLFNPNIRFDIALPSSDARVKEIVYSSIDTTNRAEMNRQMLYLLVLNSFSVSGMNNTFNTSLGASSLDLLSNQISSWLSQISKDLDIGINYRPGGSYTSEELAVALSTQLFDNRVSIDGNFGVTNLQEQQSATRTNNLVGDINIDVKITKDGRLRVKAFNQTNNVDLLDVGAPYTQGIGIFYRKEFDNLSEFFRKKVKADAMKGE